MSLPKPEVMGAYLEDIEHLSRAIRGLWRTAEPDAFRRPKHSSAELVSGGRVLDVSDTVAATESYRRFLRHAARDVAEARIRLQRARQALNDALATLDPPQGPEVADVRFRVHPADAGDVRQLQAAQDRRASRAQSSGDYSEVGW